jgi:hypothetical protein
MTLTFAEWYRSADGVRLLDAVHAAERTLNDARTHVARWDAYLATVRQTQRGVFVTNVEREHDRARLRLAASTAPHAAQATVAPRACGE